MAEPLTSKPQGSHWDGCWEYGMEHYECAQKQVERLTAELALERESHMSAERSLERAYRERDRLRALASDAIAVVDRCAHGYAALGCNAQANATWDHARRLQQTFDALAGAADETTTPHCSSCSCAEPYESADYRRGWSDGRAWKEER